MRGVLILSTSRFDPKVKESKVVGEWSAPKKGVGYRGGSTKVGSNKGGRGWIYGAWIIYFCI